MYTYVVNSPDEIRLDFEARSILQELERLKSFPENQKHRFIWELIQNAKDCVRPNERVNISISLEKDRFTFVHNGLEFRVKDLIALARRGSTKVYDENRLGTGFMKTHLLNKVVTIKGQLVTPRGFRDFKLTLKRTADNLSDMKMLLEETYQIIDGLTHGELVDSSSRKASPLSSPSPSKSSSSSSSAGFSSFEYDLDPDSYALACSALADLKRNILFVLAINEAIQSVTVNQNGTQLSYVLRCKPVYKKILRVKIPGLPHSMLIRPCDSFGLILGLNCIKSGPNDYFLTSVSHQTKLYKDFPLVGTEEFNCAPLIQSSQWLPSDLKDGVRLKKTSEAEIDPVADTNRSILCAYRDYWIAFIRELIELQVLNRYVLATSGLPRYSNRYSDNLWFRQTIQLPLRKFIRTQDLIRNTLSTSELYYYSRIDDCLFPDCPVQPKAWHNIATQIITKSKDCPHVDVASHWINIINQDYRDWGLPVKFSVYEAIQFIESTSIDYISKNEDRAICWLNEFIQFLSSNNSFQDITEKRSILPSQNGILRSFQGPSNKFQRLLYYDNGIDEVLKDILTELGDDIRDNLLHKGITNKISWLPEMRIDSVFINLETLLNKLNVLSDKLDPNLLESAYTLSLLYHDKPDEITTKFLNVLKSFYPSIVSHPICQESFEVYPRSFFQRWTLTTLVMRVGAIIDCDEDAKFNVDQLCKAFSLIENIYDWINDLIYLLEECNLINLLHRYKLIPLQNGQLTSLSEEIFLEDDSNTFENDEISFKELVSTYIKDDDGVPVDCYSWLVDNRIKCKKGTIQTGTVNRLTFMLDSIFKSVVNEISQEEECRNDSLEDWIRLFHILNIWCGNLSERADLFPILTAYKGLLMIKAHGVHGSKMALTVLYSGISLDKIEKLINIDLDADLLEAIATIGSKNREQWLHGVIKRQSEVDTFLGLQMSINELEELSSLIGTIGIIDFKRRIDNLKSSVNGDDNRLIAVDFDNEAVSREGTAIWKSPLGSIVEDILSQTFKGYPSFKIDRAEMGKDFTITNSHNNQRFSLKICSLIEGQHFIRFTKLDALTACVEKGAYTLCVVDFNHDRDYFQSQAKFVLNIGQLIEEKIKMKQMIENNDSICISPESSEFSVLIFKDIWTKGVNFDSFYLQVSKYLFHE